MRSVPARYLVRARGTAPCEPSSSSSYTENACVVGEDGAPLVLAMKFVWLDVLGEIPYQRGAVYERPPYHLGLEPFSSVRAVRFEHPSSSILQSEFGDMALVSLDFLVEDTANAPRPDWEGASPCTQAWFDDPYACGPWSGGRAVHWTRDATSLRFLRVTDDEVCEVTHFFSDEEGAYVEEVLLSTDDEVRYCWPRRQLDCLVEWEEGQGAAPPDCNADELALPPPDATDGGMPF